MRYALIEYKVRVTGPLVSLSREYLCECLTVDFIFIVFGNALMIFA